MSELKKCPFCNGDATVDVLYGSFDFPDPDKFYAQCEDCLASGPARKTVEDAVIEWNKANIIPHPTCETCKYFNEYKMGYDGFCKILARVTNIEFYCKHHEEK